MSATKPNDLSFASWKPESNNSVDPTTANEYGSDPPMYPPPPPPLQYPTGYPVNTAIQHGLHQDPTNWSTGLCDCTEDINNCLITCICPCVTFGQNADILDRGSPSCEASGALYSLICFVTGFQWVYSCFYRTKLKRIYHFPDEPCYDLCVHCLCEPCALCQEYRELKNHGFDMGIGWHANMERQQGMHGVVIMEPPMVQGGMIGG